MAPSTRKFAAMEDHVRSLEMRLEEQNRRIEEKNRRLEEQSRNQSQTMEAMMRLLQELKDSRPMPGSGVNSPRSLNIGGEESNQAIKPQGMIPKLQCPVFDGSNPRLWIRK